MTITARQVIGAVISIAGATISLVSFFIIL